MSIGHQRLRGCSGGGSAVRARECVGQNHADGKALEHRQASIGLAVGEMSATRGARPVVERIVIAAGAVVICLDAVAAWLVVQNDCFAIFGLLLWAGAAVGFFFGALLPVLFSLLGAGFRGPVRTVFLAACLGVALPIGLFSMQDYPHIGRCVG